MAWLAAPGVVGTVVNLTLAALALVLVIASVLHRAARRRAAEQDADAARAAGATPAAAREEAAIPRPVRAAGRAAPHRAPQQPRIVSLREVVAEMAEVGDNETSFLDTSTGEFVRIADDLVEALRRDEPVAAGRGLDPLRLEQLRARFAAGELVELPTKFEIREYSIRERFIEDIHDAAQREAMLNALRGPNAFRAFEAGLRRLGIEQKWERARDEEFARIAAPWIQENGLRCEEDAAAAQPGAPLLRRAS